MKMEFLALIGLGVMFLSCAKESGNKKSPVQVPLAEIPCSNGLEADGSCAAVVEQPQLGITTEVSDESSWDAIPCAADSEQCPPVEDGVKTQ